jgi:ribosomal protein L16 Arg81 hydroxylase
MSPLKGGFFNMWTGNKGMAAAQRHIPTRFVVLEEGDLLYNPDWTWHKVTSEWYCLVLLFGVCFAKM